MVTLNKKGYGLLGSCKWWTKPVGVNVLDELYEARAVLGSKAAQARLALFSRAGFTDAVWDRAEPERILLVEPADLFA